MHCYPRIRIKFPQVTNCSPGTVCGFSSFTTHVKGGVAAAVHPPSPRISRTLRRGIAREGQRQWEGAPYNFTDSLSRITFSPALRYVTIRIVYQIIYTLSLICRSLHVPLVVWQVEIYKRDPLMCNDTLG